MVRCIGAPHRSSSDSASDFAASSGYHWVVEVRRLEGHSRHMSKRALATTLWFLAGWGLGAILVELLAVSQLIAVLVGIGVAAFVWMDPLGALWAREVRPEPTPAAQHEPI